MRETEQTTALTTLIAGLRALAEERPLGYTHLYAERIEALIAEATRETEEPAPMSDYDRAEQWWRARREEGN